MGGYRMLDTLDILIGFTLIMLIMSMAVTILTQLVGSGLFNLRGRALKIGIARLLALLDRGLTPEEGMRIADHILRNPLVGQSMLIGSRHRLAEVVHREELVKLVLDFAAHDDAEKADPQNTADEAGLRAKVLRSLKANGIDNPGEILRQVRNALIDLEKTSPELSHSARLNIAILHFAGSEFLSKVNSWFDQTIDRVSDAFTVRIRFVTACVALLLALALQLDSVGLINRLSVDDDLRRQLVAVATQDPARFDPARRVLPSAIDQEDQVKQPTLKEALKEIEDAGFGELREFGLVAFPGSWDEWAEKWTEGGKGGWFRTLFGILLSAALLSLGAPFWYAILRDLLKLRSLIARKDDAERVERQTTQVPTPGGTTLPVQFRGGEAGDLDATG